MSRRKYESITYESVPMPNVQPFFITTILKNSRKGYIHFKPSFVTGDTYIVLEDQKFACLWKTEADANEFIRTTLVRGTWTIERADVKNCKLKREKPRKQTVIQTKDGHCKA